MTTTFSGPMFAPHADRYRRSLHGESGGHYNIFEAKDGLRMLRDWFPNGEGIDGMNLVFFSTSGVHGSGATIEQVEESLIKYPGGIPDGDDWPDDYSGNEITFLLVQPRLVGMTYGNIVVTLEDIPYLKKLRELSWKAASTIGMT